MSEGEKTIDERLGEARTIPAAFLAALLSALIAKEESNA